MPYPVIFNGDHAEFERERASTKPEDRPDWPLPSFDARDWAKACADVTRNKLMTEEEYEELLQMWFANALMRGYDEARKAS